MTTDNRLSELESSILADIQGSTNGQGRLLTPKELESVARVRARAIAEREAYRAGCDAALDRTQDLDCPDCGSGSWQAKGIRTMGDNPENIFFVECKVCGWSERYGTPKKISEEEANRGKRSFTYGT